MDLGKWVKRFLSKSGGDCQTLPLGDYLGDYSVLLELYSYDNKHLVTELYTQEQYHPSCKYFCVEFKVSKADKTVLQKYINNIDPIENGAEVERSLRVIGRTIDKWYKDNQGKVIIYYPVKGTQNYEGGYISDGWVLTLKEDRFVLEAEVRLLKDED